jgi:hypothetical protein
MTGRRVTVRVLCVAAVFGPLAAVACTASTGTNPADAGVGAAAAASCQTSGYATDTYAPNIQKVGKPASGDVSDAGALTFILEDDEVGDASTAPIEPYLNVFALKLVDSSGQPVKNADVSFPTSNPALGWPFVKNPWMPQHTHGASVPPKVTNNEDGTYTLAVDFSMADVWQLYIVAKTDTVTDSAEFAFCLQ